MNPMPIRLLSICLFTAVAIWNSAARAALVLTSTQSPAAAAANFNMGSVQTLSYTMTNNNTGVDTGKNFSAVRFSLAATGTNFTSRPAAPAGWYLFSYAPTSVTFRANNSGSAIALNQSVVFSLPMAMGTSAVDAAETFSAIQGFYNNSLKSTYKVNASSLGSWARKSLSITSFQITDTAGTPVTALGAGSSFKLVMTVQNNSSATQNNVVANPVSPAASKTGTVTQLLTATTGSPLSLAPGALGTISFTYITLATDNGTINFAANAQNLAAATSSSASSSSVALNNFVAGLGASASCLYAGSSLTITMTIANSTGSAITGISGTLTPVAGAPVTLVSGPTPASIANLANAASSAITWVYTVNATGNTNPFSFSGSATGRGNTGCVCDASGANCNGNCPGVNSAVTTPVATISGLVRGAFSSTVDPSSTNAESANKELVFTVINNGCASVNSVAATIPAGWTYANDAYSLVNLSATSSIETWVVSGANPVTFTAPNLAGQLPKTFGGEFGLVFTAMPSAATSSTFTLRVTDSTGVAVDVPVTVTVSAFNTDGLNNAKNKVWHEDFR